MEDNLGSYNTDFDYETSNGNAGMTLPVKLRPIRGHRSCNSLVGYFTINNKMLFYNYQYVIYSVFLYFIKTYSSSSIFLLSEPH